MWILIITCFVFTNSIKYPQLKVNDQIIASIPWPFTICGQGNWNIQSVKFEEVPVRKSNDNIQVTGTATDSINFLKVDINVKLNGAQLHNETVSFTSSYDQGDLVDFNYKNYIPDFAPSGTYTLTMNFFNTNPTNQGCVQFSFKL